MSRTLLGEIYRQVFLTSPRRRPKTTIAFYNGRPFVKIDPNGKVHYYGKRPRR